MENMLAQKVNFFNKYNLNRQEHQNWKVRNFMNKIWFFLDAQNFEKLNNLKKI